MDSHKSFQDRLTNSFVVVKIAFHSLFTAVYYTEEDDLFAILGSSL